MKKFQLPKLNMQGATRRLTVVGIMIAIGVMVTAVALPVRSFANVGPESLCGSGYQVVRQTQVPGRLATAYILKNYNTQTACGVVISTGSDYGVAKQMYAHIYIVSADGNYTLIRNSPSDMGQYKYYAGPVYVSYAGLPMGYDEIAFDARSRGTQVVLLSY